MNTGIMSIIASLMPGRGKPDAAAGVEPMAQDGDAPAQPDPMRYLLEDMATRIAAGFDTRDEIVERSLEAADDEGLALDQAEIERMVDDGLRAHAALEATWTDTTDNDRLEAAMTKLEESGIVFRENFTCCGTCGSAEIWDEIETAREAGTDVRGYAFYHMQDADAAASGGGVYLAYGAVEQSNEAAVAIGHEIEAQMQEQGLTTQWNGSIGRRILVNLEWRRRRTSPESGAEA